MATHDGARARLLERLDMLAQRSGRIGADLRRLVDRDWEEQAAELENDEVLAGLDAMTRTELREIGDALRRLEAGRYGTCTNCGQTIGATRLAALPAAPRCVACATQVEDHS
jgi:RNA polymerase-binding transcription factor DksA